MGLFEIETTLKENIPANLMRGIEAVGGKMTITNERIIFTPHVLNIQTKPLEIGIHEITAVEKRNSLFIVPNGIKIVVKHGQAYKFVVWKREELIGLIRGAIGIAHR
ncbi:GRAM domain-containing protein [Brevibacillus fluminis]|uniref:GRAM domain-containing protein n=1 Tax=Brevibacillus fluminis TaxID=511487 RepID=UPI003F8B0F9F